MNSTDVLGPLTIYEEK
ncbi:hypothetical protein C5167_013904 [Papaver somniferum]|uniref:Uncharacterized protein n=1 Tax=Papaver somniferum TaxID=3469 RepID=A0A4Y7J5Y6_PAPSO|nr:hypothetical protein C5167_013904 [Papaver somniferum]